MRQLFYTFTEEQADEATAEWGFNCGPGALAFALQTTIEAARAAVMSAGFAEKGYTSPSMMRAALAFYDVGWEPQVTRDGRCGISDCFGATPALVRVQWTGPWTAPGSNQRWAYGHTHWIATWLGADGHYWAFDVNGGMMLAARWEHEIVPVLTGMNKRSDGGWYPTHAWFIRDRGRAPIAPRVMLSAGGAS